MRRMAASDARRDFAEVVNRVAYGKERVIIGRRGKEWAAVIPMADLRLLERLGEKLQDRMDAEDALRVEADERDESVPWEQVKRSWGLRYHVEVKRSAQRDLARLPARVREDVARALDGLAENPRPGPPAAQPLKGYPGLCGCGSLAATEWSTGSTSALGWCGSG